MSVVSAVGLAETRAALAAGATPSTALVAGFANEPRLAPLVSALRLGSPLAAAAADLATGDASTDLLVRALAVAEQTGSGAAAAVDQALAAAHDDALTERLLRSRTAQARGTATLLAGLPALGWVAAAGMGNVAGFLRTALGGATTTLAVVLAGCGVLWSRALIRRAGSAGRRADPLGATETVELVAVALAGGLSPGAALAAVAPLAPPGAREPLVVAARRVRGGWTPGEALAGTGLQPLGEVLEATQRWGAPAQQALGALAADLRAQRRAAAEEAAERVQLLLVFPTTLLTLPAFVLGVVPPLLWGALRG